MKHDLKISKIAIICVLCTAVSGAYGASSVRALGGSGTYSSASEAVASGDGGTSGSTATVRGGSLRVSPTTSSSGTSTTTSTGNTTTGRVATSPRLSIGHYLGGGTSISGGSSLRPVTPGGSVSGGSSGGDGGDFSGLQSQIDQLNRDVEGLRDADDLINDQLLDKQDLLISGDELIEIDQSNNEIFINTDNLADAIKEKLPSSREVEIRSNGVSIQWRYIGDSQWNDIVSLDELRGPQGEPGESVAIDEILNAIEDDLQAAVDDAVAAAVAGAVADEIAKADLVTGTELSDELSNYMTKTDLSGYATTEALERGLAGKQNAALTQTVGEASTETEYPSAAAVYKAIEDATSGIVTSGDIEQFKQDVAGLKTTVGDENSGLVKDVSDLKSDVAGIDASVEEVGQLAGAAASDAQQALDALNGKQDALGYVAENAANKKTTLTNSDTDYPSTSAVTSALAGKANADTVNELGQRVTDVENTIGTGEFATSDKTVIGAINELKNKTDGIPTEGNFAEMNEKLTQMEQDLSGKQDVANMTNTLVDDTTKYPTSAAVYKELETKAFKTDLDNYATKEELNDKADSETVQQLQATVGNEESGLVADVARVDSSLALKQDVSAREALTITNDETKYPSSAAVTAALAGKANTSDLDAYVTDEELAGAGYVTGDEVTGAVNDAIDAAGVVTDETLNTTLENYVTDTDLNQQLELKADKANTYTKTEVDEMVKNIGDVGSGEVASELAKKQDKQIGQDASGNILVVGADGNITNVESIDNSKVNGLGALATKGLISNADVAADAGIEQSKLSLDVQQALEKADNAVSTLDAPANSVLATDENGDPVWYEIAM